MGVPSWLAGVRDRLGEAIGRAVDLPAYTVSVVTAKLRPQLNALVSVFVMAGQIVYDAITHFLPGDPSFRDVRIDFWCATVYVQGIRIPKRKDRP
jgi:hypothetical protein